VPVAREINGKINVVTILFCFSFHDVNDLLSSRSALQVLDFCQPRFRDVAASIL
jgi:hypothetical protein